MLRNLSGFVGCLRVKSECQEAQSSRRQLEAIGREWGRGSRSGRVAEAWAMKSLLKPKFLGKFRAVAISMGEGEG